MCFQWFLVEGRHFRLMGVLQRIGICFSLVGMLVIFLRNAKLQWILFGFILVAYSAILIAGGSLEPNLNLADKLDTLVLGKLSYIFDPVTGLAREPEGILSTIPSIATVLLGVRAGAMLRSGQVQGLWQIGLGMMVLTYLLGVCFPGTMPVNKQLWTSTFVLWTGGCAMICLSLAHRLVDLRGFPPVGISFGVNAIAAYGGSWLATCLIAWSGIMGPLYQKLFSGPLVPLFGEHFASLAFALSFTAIFGVIMLYLRKRNWRFSI